MGGRERGREMEIANINLTNKSYPAGVFFFFFLSTMSKKKVFNELVVSEIFMAKYVAANKLTWRKS